MIMAEPVKAHAVIFIMLQPWNLCFGFFSNGRGSYNQSNVCVPVAGMGFYAGNAGVPCSLIQTGEKRAVQLIHGSKKDIFVDSASPMAALFTRKYASLWE